MQTVFDLHTFLISANPELDEQKPGTAHVKAWLEYYAPLPTTCDCRPDSTTGFFGCPHQDSDGGAYAWDFYYQLWLKNPTYKCVKREDPKDSPRNAAGQIVVQGDWMCSIATTYRRAMRLWPGDSNWRWDFINEHFYDEEYGFATAEYIEPLAEFIREAYTLANLVIVPNGFNTRRSIPWKTDDYWDLSTYHFIENNCAFLGETSKEQRIHLADLMREMISKDPNNLFLDDWLAEKDGRLAAKLLPGHSVESPRPQSREDWYELIGEMTRRIQLRRKRIQDFLGK
ncbi:hypothetical protein [Trueperella sp. LYQ143]|uniref:hypothetical protein n=1 Tax=Trueperella sp. LYQ143 TaxID=3391059 RepID=UPI003983B1D7